MAEFLDTWLFHWAPAKAVWIGGYTLSWDARCAGIYAGFGAALLCQLAAGSGFRGLPALRYAAACAALALPLFLDVLSLYLGLRAPSNDVRFLTGLLFGGGFGAFLLPVFLLLLGGEESASRSGRPFAAILAALAAVFAAKSRDSAIAFGAVEALCIAGCLGLAAMLASGTWLAAGRLLRREVAARSLLLAVAIGMLAGCAAPQRVARTGACDEATFVPASNVYGDCRKEVCVGGRIELVEDLASAAPVDDWAEEKFCLLHPIDCIRAYSLKDKAEQWQKDNTGRYWTKDELRNGLADATRHAYLMCLMAEKFGPEFARGVGVAHEEDSEYLIFTRKAAPSNPCCEKVMDLYNNDVGIDLAAQPGTCEDKVLNSLPRLKYLICRRGGDC